MGELGLVIWERVLVRPLSAAMTSRIVSALNAARESNPDSTTADILRTAIHSMVDVQVKCFYLDNHKIIEKPSLPLRISDKT